MQLKWKIWWIKLNLWFQKKPLGENLWIKIEYSDLGAFGLKGNPMDFGQRRSMPIKVMDLLSYLGFCPKGNCELC